ncbi:uracil-DNA glycosylase family protein [Oceanicaulis sp. MMSF_3324]|uniref:uracil-DNA glycosylase family protein n=1 Tax=Oceanicaulis sp. MMSF_3324 TaxID=3046702 RepID=UPI00273E4000|nr:uracil-DNA glycosylase family protein [Oceanicaulis sp. MMSF_3324]
MYQQYIDIIKSHIRQGSLIENIEADLTLYEDGRLRAEYAPFDYVERSARVVIVGLTPGRQQARNALRALIEALQGGANVEVALEVAKKTGSFSGPLRRNLTAMLDHIGVNTLLGVQSAEQLFDEEARGAHFTSALRYPVFVNGENYSGAPKPLGVPALKSMIETYLAEETAILDRAIWIPLGTHASDALLHLVASGALDRDRVLAGLPHPSGANAERVAYFLNRKGRDELSRKTRPESIEQAREQLKGQIAKLS